MAQAFQRLGTQVTVLSHSERILPRDDAEMAERLTERLRGEGLEIVFHAEPIRVARGGAGREVTVRTPEGVETYSAAELLVATGRSPQVEDLGLEAAGVRASRRGVEVNQHLRTSAPGIWAAGDVTGTWQFSHIAEYEATLAVRNALQGVLPATADYDTAGWTTYTDPELAHAGLTETQVQERGLPYQVYRWSYAEDDRARVDEVTEGWVRVLAHPTSGRIWGADILGERAGELISEFMIAIRRRIPASELGQIIHVYPTLTQVSQRACQTWWEGWSASSRLAGLAKTWMRWRGFNVDS
jgi:pyruvate/2-oxoglutarate dehydrogenase complex dihydrolipoamide dehydrogenase (E3) component